MRASASRVTCSSSSHSSFVSARMAGKRARIVKIGLHGEQDALLGQSNGTVSDGPKQDSLLRPARRAIGEVGEVSEIPLSLVILILQTSFTRAPFAQNLAMTVDGEIKKGGRIIRFSLTSPISPTGSAFPLPLSVRRSRAPAGHSPSGARL